MLNYINNDVFHNNYIIVSHTETNWKQYVSIISQGTFMILLLLVFVCYIIQYKINIIFRFSIYTIAILLIIVNIYLDFISSASWEIKILKLRNNLVCFIFLYALISFFNVASN